MRYVPRRIEKELKKAARGFPALIVTGPRRAGKTTLLRHAFPKASYYLLEDPDLVGRVRADPRGFLEEIERPVILDEIQNTPELLNYIRTEVDATPRRRGQWLLTGSQELPLMRGITESMAGRAAVFQLPPLAVAESPKVSVLKGGFPEVLDRPSVRQTWFRSYVQTYLERDVRAVSAIRDLATFRRFLALTASRCGQMLNKTAIAGPLAVSVPTVSDWLGILEITGQIVLVPPFFENFGKRLVKSPKLYFVDSGLLCHLLGLETEASLRRSPFHGPVFEGFVASEIFKLQVGSGRRRELYHFRDQQGLEVDFVVPLEGTKIALIEAKAAKTIRSDGAPSLSQLAGSSTQRPVSCFIVHGGAATKSSPTVVRPGVRALPVSGLSSLIS